MSTEKLNHERILLREVPEIMEMEMEEYDPMRDKYSDVTGKINKLVKNLVLMRVNNKRNEINILYLFQKMNEKQVNSECYEQIFNDLDHIFDDVNNNSYKYEELIAKNNELGKRLNPLIKDLFK